MGSSKWCGRLATAGFLFFFVKGLVWLALAGAAVAGLAEATG
jgi:hypothetical protein